MSYLVGPAEPRDLPLLPPLEEAAERMFAPLGIVFPPGPTVIEEMIRLDARILVVGDPAVGFAAVSELDGATHLEQIAVRPDLVRRGIGTALLNAVIAAADAPGAAGVTLLTFRDVPWNAPWYARHGFVELPADRWGPGLRRHWEAEVSAGLHDLGPRLVMWRPRRE